jgi:hypothetical protein
MSEFPPGTFIFAERTMELAAQSAQRETNARGFQSRVRSGRQSFAQFYFRALAWLGQCLAAWGERLQERYGAEESAGLPQVG